MSWLDDRDVIYRYKRPDGEIVHLKISTKDESPSQLICDDGVVALYDGFEAEPVHTSLITTYDQNGRIGVRIRGRDGNIQHISKTKLNYMKTGKVENQYTPAFKERLQKAQQTEMLRSDIGPGKGKATALKRKEREKALKDMPDGEYLSDGKNMMPVPGKENT